MSLRSRPVLASDASKDIRGGLRATVCDLNVADRLDLTPSSSHLLLAAMLLPVRSPARASKGIVSAFLLASPRDPADASPAFPAFLRERGVGVALASSQVTLHLVRTLPGVCI